MALLVPTRQCICRKRQIPLGSRLSAETGPCVLKSYSRTAPAQRMTSAANNEKKGNRDERQGTWRAGVGGVRSCTNCAGPRTGQDHSLPPLRSPNMGRINSDYLS